MSHGEIREDKNCLNCGHLVEERFCPHCGQENTETRQRFHYLFTHFVEDFTHYDGQFWSTLKNLIFRPGKLTKEYLSGRRQSFVAPVKLYIFVSFVAFLVPAILPESENTDNTNTVLTEQNKKANDEKIIKTLQRGGLLSDEETKAELEKIINEQKKNPDNKIEISEGSSKNTREAVFFGAKNIKEYDSISKHDKSMVNKFLRPVAKKYFIMKEKNMSSEEITNQVAETLFKTIPKALFLYMPLFAFFLWLFHSKKEWWYFDHGIFTLHYFSFLLLFTLFFSILDVIFDIIPDLFVIQLISFLIYTVLTLYLLSYFFIAHHRVYRARKSMSILKGIALFVINFFSLLIMFCVLLYISFLMIH